MKHIPALFFMGLSIAIATPFVTHGAGPTVSFGGRVYLAPIPGVLCTGVGTSTISSANIQGVAQTVQGVNQLSNGGGVAEGIGNTISGIYNAIPVYATNPRKRPTYWGQILGRKKLIPDFTTCHAGITIPIPVLKTTNNYNVSH